MNGPDLGSLWEGMTEGDLAQAMACASVLASRASPWPRAPKEVLERVLEQSDTYPLVAASSWWLRDAIVWYGERPDGEELAEAWRSLVAEEPRRLRIEVSERDPHAFWLLRQLLHPKVGALSAYLRRDAPDLPVVWEWPLRLGILGSATSPNRKRLIDALSQLRYPDLWSLVDMHRPGSECELLLLDGDLPSALRDLLDAPHRPQADCVLVLDGRGLEADRSTALMQAVRHQARTSGVALLSAADRIATVLTALIAQLSHDKTLDVALADAIREVSGEREFELHAPELVCSRSLAVHSSVRLSAARLARDLSPARAHIPITRTGLQRDASIAYAARANDALEATTSNAHLDGTLNRLNELVESGRWLHETADATDLADIRRGLQNASGNRHRSAPVSLDRLAPQPVEAATDDRQVVTVVRPHGEMTSTTVLREEQLYSLDLHIGKLFADAVGSGVPFPAEDLPFSQDGHTLDISFVPLVADEGRTATHASQAKIFLPPWGESEECSFVIDTRRVKERYRARILISYSNSILQTLLLDAPLAGESKGEAPYRLSVENVVQPGFQNLAYRQPFDAALVINHAVDGQPGLTALVDDSVRFVQPHGMQAAIEALQTTLTNNTALRLAETNFESEELANLIFGLMQSGHVLFTTVQSLIGKLDRDAGRIQLVEARSEAAFPVEYLYPLEVPRKRPPMCPHAKDALKETAGAISHQDCPHRDNKDHMCPMRFWGFRKQVERQPASLQDIGTSANVTKLAVPPVLAGKLDLLRCVQVARSNKVQAADYDPPTGLLKVLASHCATVHSSMGWDEWEAGISQKSPDFLLLLSHTDIDEVSSLAALEISGELLSVGQITAKYVKGPDSNAPVVFLLGCDTANPKLGFMNFVQSFKQMEAALVIGTLSTISAQRAARFMAVALPLLADAQNKGRTFGEVFLEVKRAALAEGDGFALSLVAYGNTSWQL